MPCPHIRDEQRLQGDGMLPVVLGKQRFALGVSQDVADVGMGNAQCCGKGPALNSNQCGELLAVTGVW